MSNESVQNIFILLGLTENLREKNYLFRGP